MRMTTQDSAQAVVGEAEHEQKYEIEFNPFMASLLSDKLYTDKPLACWRELYANAHDESDKIKVRVPDWEDQTCMIWDNGRGLDKDELIGLFCTYGASNKRDTNSKIGGFGVGSKVLFSYTDSFSAFSVKDGIKTNIICYKNDEGMPTARILGHAPTDEQSGTCIEWAVSLADAEQFRRTAIEVFSRFKHKPTFVNEDLQDHEWMSDPYSLLTEEWGVRSEEFSESLPRTGEGAMMVMGGIAYPLDATSIGYTYQKALSGAVDIFAPIGAVQLAASREALSYDAKTVQYVKQRLDDMIRDADQMVTDQLATAANWYDREVMREGVVNPLPFLEGDHREVPEIEALEVRTWKRGYRGSSTPTRLKFEVSSNWLIEPRTWEITRTRTAEKWSTAHQDDDRWKRYGTRRRYSAYDAVFRFPEGKGMPAGFTTRSAAFLANYSNIRKILILSDDAYQWMVDHDVPTDCVMLWDKAMHDKWKLDSTSPAARTYARKEFAQVTVNEVVAGSTGYLSLRSAGTLGLYVPDEDDKEIRWYALSNQDDYVSDDNPGIKGLEREVGWLCSAGFLEVRTVPKSYAKVLGGQFRNVNKCADEFKEHIDQLLKEHPLLDGYVRSKLQEKYHDLWMNTKGPNSNGFKRLRDGDWEPPKWVFRFASIWIMNWFERRSGEALEGLVDKKKAEALIEKELDSTTKRVHKHPLFFPLVRGVEDEVPPPEVITALVRYLET